MVHGQVAVFIFVISIVSKPGRGGRTVKKENDVSDKKEEVCVAWDVSLERLPKKSITVLLMIYWPQMFGITIQNYASGLEISDWNQKR